MNIPGTYDTRPVVSTLPENVRGTVVAVRTARIILLLTTEGKTIPEKEEHSSEKELVTTVLKTVPSQKLSTTVKVNHN